ncbi:MAG: hypothetical protein UY92_C0006G0032 [Candidatus Magasanikbacteria bacterium GW2011_GWA2_56_11]|uniref:Uncharacterized protein n=1 Tax=Candidatus Magasanikbacteria bacterium GW2011_GWA2_56_11 TaxID=1619044 RepID=A0A0G1YGU8_9BACT|nr:MAG: hypothetical protein UY92_C0006G0032 [Candidatus Magasanikbacteria bacterium GW2011_GWA2_56_11]
MNAAIFVFVLQEAHFIRFSRATRETGCHVAKRVHGTTRLNFFIKDGDEPL